MHRLCCAVSGTFCVLSGVYMGGQMSDRESTDETIVSSMHETDDTEEQGTSHREKTTNPWDVLDAFDTILAFLGTHKTDVTKGQLAALRRKIYALMHDKGHATHKGRSSEEGGKGAQGALCHLLPCRMRHSSFAVKYKSCATCGPAPLRFDAPPWQMLWHSVSVAMLSHVYPKRGRACTCNYTNISSFHCQWLFNFNCVFFCFFLLFTF